MVKRPPSPPPADDEPKYLTVFHPYPLNAHWELPADIVAFARWIACCIGTEPFIAFFYKPRANGMVILEIQRKFPHFDRILGEHRWSEFLKAPTDEELEKSTQIFFCTYRSDREAQKDGWKRINVKDEWFNQWSPNNPTIKQPYPATHWCAVPPELRTNKTLCRPLPVAMLPPPKKPPPPVVGSEGWINAKATPSPTPASLRGAWARGRGGPAVPATRGGAPSSRGAAPTASKSGASLSTRSTASVTLSTSPPSRWGAPAPPSLRASASSPPAPSPAPPSRWSSPLNTAAAPSALGHPSTRSPQSAAADYPAPPGLVRHGGSSGGSSSSIASPVPADDAGSAPAEAYLPPWERASDAAWSAAGEEALWSPGVYGVQGEEVVESLWADEAPRDAPAVILCAAHGVICKKGICKEYAKQLREAERKKKEEERRNEAEEKKRGKGRGWGKSGGGRRGANENGSEAAADKDGFSVVGGKGKKAKSAAPAAGDQKKPPKDPWADDDDDEVPAVTSASKKKGPAKDPWADDDTPATETSSQEGSHGGRIRAYSSASTADSGGWGAPSQGPW